MRPFEYVRVADLSSVTAAMATTPQAKFLAGGTNLVDLMKEDIERPTRIVDIT
ncbi:MAG: xanthine dehydrogenase family protein subunit M, partial [Alcaligenaceae bacterium]